MLFTIRNIDKKANLYFDAKTPYEAMSKLVYYLGVKDNRQKNIKIQKTDSNRFLYVIHKGDTYCTKMNEAGDDENG